MYYIPTYYDIEELVCRDVYNKYKDQAWQFFDPRLLKTIDWIRQKLNKPVFINNWNSGGNFDERGLRCIQCSIVKQKMDFNTLYLSAHIFGRAADFDVQGMVAEEVRQWISRSKYQLPFPVRLEKNVSWVHIDVQNMNDELVYLFNP